MWRYNVSEGKQRYIDLKHITLLYLFKKFTTVRLLIFDHYYWSFDHSFFLISNKDEKFLPFLPIHLLHWLSFSIHLDSYWGTWKTIQWKWLKNQRIFRDQLKIGTSVLSLKHFHVFTHFSQTQVLQSAVEWQPSLFKKVDFCLKSREQASSL